MIEEINKEIETSKEVFSSLPTSNQKAIDKYLNEIDSYEQKYSSLKDKIYEELILRADEYFNVAKTSSEDIDNALNQISKALVYSNDMTTPYEKLKLDKNIYQLANYKADDLLENNKRILKILKKFQIAGVHLNSKSFDYTNYVYGYMSVLLKNINNLESNEIKEAFDKVYWKCPTIFTQIELNFRYLYLKNEKTFTRYILGLQKEINSKFANNSQNLINSYSKLRNDKNNIMFNNKNNLLSKFSSQEYKPDDYLTPVIDKLKENKFESSDISYAMALKCSLEEYKNYLKYKKIIEKIQEINAAELEKNYIKARMKNISKLEKKLFKLNKKAKISTRKTRIDKYEIEINQFISDIKAIYNELDENIFKIRVKEKIEGNSTIFKGLLLASGYYVFMADTLKEINNNNITYEEIDKEIKELYAYVLNPNNQIINNTAIGSKNSLADVIVEMYKLSNVNITTSDLEENSIDNYINDINKILTKEKLDEFNIDLSIIKEYEEIRKIRDQKK